MHESRVGGQRPAICALCLIRFAVPTIMILRYAKAIRRAGSTLLLALLLLASHANLLWLATASDACGKQCCRTRKSCCCRKKTGDSPRGPSFSARTCPPGCVQAAPALKLQWSLDTAAAHLLLALLVCGNITRPFSSVHRRTVRWFGLFQRPPPLPVVTAA